MNTTLSRVIPLAALALSLTTVSVAATAVFTQQAFHAEAKHGGKGNPHKAAMKIAKKLNLSQEQTAKLEPILAERRNKMQALNADTTLTDAQRKAQRKTITQTARLQMGNILSPEQRKQLKSLRQEKAREAAGAPTGV